LIVPNFEVRVGDAKYRVNAPDEATAWDWANLTHEQGRARESKRAEGVAQAQRSERERFAAEEAGRPWAQRMVTNLGAGFDTAYEGLKGLVGQGMSDADLTEKRETDKRLAEGTTGGGLMQAVGETLPTAVVPGGAAARGANILTRALGSSRALKGFGATAADAALMGGAAGALQPVLSDESRAANVAQGAVGGAGTVGALKGLGMAGKYAGDWVRGLTRAGAQTRAGEKFEEAIGPMNLPAALAKATRPPGDLPDIPLSTAAVTGSPELAMAERAARATSPPDWARLDADTNRAAWNRIEKSTENAGDLDALRAARSAKWDKATEAAYEKIDPELFAKQIATLRWTLGANRLTPTGQGRMRPVLDDLARRIDEVGPENFSPAHLQDFRAEVAGAVKGMPSAPFTALDRGDPGRMQMRGQVDDLLNHATEGAWQNVLDTYKAASIPVSAARASEAIRGRFISPEGVPRAGEQGGVPKVTRHALGQAMRTLGESRFGDQLAPATRKGLTETLEALQKKDIVQEMKSAGTGGGGSNTLMDIVATQRGLTPESRLLSALWNTAKNRKDRLLAEEVSAALRDPQRFVQITRAALAAGQPLSAARQQVLLEMSRATAAGAGTLATTQ
jgi:hypothetical protein